MQLWTKAVYLLLLLALCVSALHAMQTLQGIELYNDPHSTQAFQGELSVSFEGGTQILVKGSDVSWVGGERLGRLLLPRFWWLCGVRAQWRQLRELSVCGRPFPSHSPFAGRRNRLTGFGRTFYFRDTGGSNKFVHRAGGRRNYHELHKSEKVQNPVLRRPHSHTLQSIWQPSLISSGAYSHSFEWARSWLWEPRPVALQLCRLDQRGQLSWRRYRCWLGRFHWAHVNEPRILFWRPRLIVHFRLNQRMSTSWRIWHLSEFRAGSVQERLDSAKLWLLQSIFRSESGANHHSNRQPRVLSAWQSHSQHWGTRV